MVASLQSHADSKTKHLNKFRLFCAKNQSMPFPYKKKVVDAVISTKILYGCESWLTENLKSIESLYMGALKSLLGVRKQTPNNIVLIEAGADPLKDKVWKQQKNFLQKKLQDVDEPLTKVYRLCERENTKGISTPSESVELRVQRFGKHPCYRNCKHHQHQNQYIQVIKPKTFSE